MSNSERSFGAAERSSNSSSSTIHSPHDDNADDGQLATRNELIQILNNSSIPQDEIVYAFAYGSGVLKQQQQQPEDDHQRRKDQSSINNNNNLVDFILCTNDSYKFHAANIAINPHHYQSMLPWLQRLTPDPAHYITWWQRHSVPSSLSSLLRNPGLYFNVSPEQNIKYGVIDIHDLCSDLQHWNYLYIAGRLQKPVVTLMDTRSNDTSYLLPSQLHETCNLPAAFSTALLLQLLAQNNSNNNNNQLVGDTYSSEYSVEDISIYTKIAGISYSGDPRMTMGAEDPQKINQLVTSPGQVQRFYQLYQPSIQSLQQEGILSVLQNNESSASQQQQQQYQSRMQFSWDYTNTLAQERLWQTIPKPIHQAVIEKQRHYYNNNISNHDTSSSFYSKIQALQDVLSNTVAKAARYQSMKGLMTAGIQQSWKYAYRKLSKGILKI